MDHGQRLKVVFMGTPDFSVAALQAILKAGHDVVCVYSQPPRKSGRGQKLHPTPVHEFATFQGLDVRTPVSFKEAKDQHDFEALEADVAVVVAYGLILPLEILQAPRMGCVNIHASLLPRWRGAAPIQRAIEAGDTTTGVTIMHMDEGLDTGPKLIEGVLPITEDMNAQDVHDALSTLGAGLIIEALAGLAAGTLNPTPQPHDGVTYAKKIDKAETQIDWTNTALDIARKIRAFYPLAWFETQGQRIRVLQVERADKAGHPGETVDDALMVACGKGALRLVILQPAGKSAMDAKAFLNGRPVPAGTRLGGV